MDENQIDLEQKYLKKVLREIKKQQIHTQEQIDSLKAQKKKLSVQYADDYYTMDDEEALLEGDRLGEFDQLIEFAENNQTRLNRQQYSPYFGRIDFGEKTARAYYIGVNNLVKDGASYPLVCDWRAPVSSLFYDYELGDAEYTSPDGRVKGKISLKRQYNIKGSKMLSMFNSSLTIGDQILKDVLSQKASSKMKTIVSTIQKEQNKIIRADINKSMLVQGVAGSGKTSIALHRIAYLLYQNKNTLKAEDVLILSPNRLFSSYIADVLPELGEENISQMSFYRLAEKELKFLGLELERREDNLEEVTQSHSRLNEVAYKNSYEFYQSLKVFCSEYFNLSFKPQDLKFGETIVTAQEMYDLYNKTYAQKTPAVRLEWLVDYILDKLNINSNINEISQKIKGMLYPFFEQTNVLNIYSNFLSSIGMKFSLNSKEQVRYDDLGGVMFIANYFFGLPKFKEVKYLIVDEMQDYSFAIYDVLNSIFDCNKTILGDINQCIEKVMTEQDLIYLNQMLGTQYFQLKKAYRSTQEITNFASKIKGITLDAFARHGEQPNIVSTTNLQKTITEIVEQNGEYNSIAILTKNATEAKHVYEQLYNISDLSLNINYDEQIAKVCIMPSYMAKGLEFDVVIVPNYNQQKYHSLLGKNLLYVSATRALHKLYIIESLT